jgi:hypothetical protein
MGQCQTCGADMAEEARFCADCGTAVATDADATAPPPAPEDRPQAIPSPAPTVVSAQGVPVQLAPGTTTVVVHQHASPGSPGVGVAGFILVIVGLIVPFVGLVGFIMSIFGYRQAKREGLSTGLSLAGIIIGAIATILGILILLLIVSIRGPSTSSSSMIQLFSAWA